VEISASGTCRAGAHLFLEPARASSRGAKARFRSVKSRRVFLGHYKRGVPQARQRAWPSTKNLVSMVSEGSVAMPFHMCEKGTDTFALNLEVTSKGARELAHGPVLASTGVLSHAILG